MTGTEDLSPLTPGINCSEIDGCESDPCFNDGITPATCKDIPWSKLSFAAPADKVWVTRRKYMYSYCRLFLVLVYVEKMQIMYNYSKLNVANLCGSCDTLDTALCVVCGLDGMQLLLQT